MLKITKRKKLLSASSPVYVDYYLVYGRIYNNDGSMYYPFTFVISLDLELDLWDCETESEIPYRDALDMLIDSAVDGAGNAFDDDAARAEFFDYCNRTIETWNSRVGHYSAAYIR